MRQTAERQKAQTGEKVFNKILRQSVSFLFYFHNELFECNLGNVSPGNFLILIYAQEIIVVRKYNTSILYFTVFNKITILLCKIISNLIYLKIDS